ncbi:MAG: hypothetical protein K6E97_04815 [Treponema sp.]|nr:hypothetical protein [Treponema sp.]
MKKIAKIITLLLLALSIFSCKQQPEERDESTELIFSEEEIAGLNQSIDITSSTDLGIPNGKYKMQIVILQKKDNYSSRETITIKFNYEGDANTATILSVTQYNIVSANDEEAKQAYTQAHSSVNINWNGLNGSCTKVYPESDFQLARILLIYPYACTPLQTNKAKTKFYGYSIIDNNYIQTCLIKQ